MSVTRKLKWLPIDFAPRTGVELRAVVRVPFGTPTVPGKIDHVHWYDGVWRNRNREPVEPICWKPVVD